MGFQPTVCLVCTHIMKLHVPLTVNFPRAAREPAQNIGVWPFAVKMLEAHVLVNF